MHALKRLLLPGLCIAIALPALASTPDTLTLTLRDKAQVAHARIVLGDVAELPAGSTLAALDLGAAPRVRQFERLTREQIAQLMRRHAGGALPTLAWDGAASVEVQTISQLVSGAQLGEAALAAVQAAFGTRHPGLSATLQTVPADLDVPVGQVQLKARALDAGRLPARAAVWVDVMNGAQVLRSAVVPVTLSLHRSAYVARRAMAAGSVAEAADFDVRDIEVAGLDAQPVGQASAAFRLRRALVPEQVLVRAMLPASGTVYPGDRVRVQVSDGPIGIEADAVVQAEAVPGQKVVVLSSISSGTVTGRLTAAGTVVIE